MEEQQIRDLIRQEISTSFDKKIGDTPTDALQLTPKKYVDGLIASIASINVYGDASDGTATLNGSSVFGFASIIASNTYLLQRDAYLDSFTVNSGVTVTSNSYRIFAQTAVNNAGTLKNNGNPGGDATVGNAGYGASVIGVGSLGPSGVGSVYGPNLPGGTTKSSWGGNGGGGGGGGGTAGAGGVASVAATRPLTPTFPQFPFDIVAGISSVVTGGAGGGHGAVGGIGNNSAGGGGSGGGLVMIVSPTIINTGSIMAVGGKGGNGVYSGVNPPGGSGGGGGGGGAVFLFYRALTNTGTISAAGGVGGTATNGGGNGNAGSDGNIFLVQVQT